MSTSVWDVINEGGEGYAPRTPEKYSQEMIKIDLQDKRKKIDACLDEMDRLNAAQRTFDAEVQLNKAKRLMDDVEALKLLIKE